MNSTHFVALPVATKFGEYTRPPFLLLFVFSLRPIHFILLEVGRAGIKHTERLMSWGFRSTSEFLAACIGATREKTMACRKGGKR